MQLGLYLIALIGLAWPLGIYMARIYKDELPGFVRWLKPVENGFYRLSGVKPGDDMPWTRYAFAMIAFNLVGFLAVYALQRFQVWLPLNPEGLANTTADSAFNTALDYELAVLKTYAEPLLKTIKTFHDYYDEAVRLLSFLGNFSPVPANLVPRQSILREFIGDSGFKY
jgi:hypothetical protein